MKVHWRVCRSSSSSRTPHLPIELWRKILGYTIRLTGSTNTTLDDAFSAPYLNEEHPEIDFSVFHDRRSLALVCKARESVVSEIACEYIVIYTAKQLFWLVKKLEASATRCSSSKSLGEWTRRVDFKIPSASYDAWHAVRLLRCTPHLLIYTNKNGPADHASRPTPSSILQALITYCSDLQRLDFSSPGEAPTYDSLATFLPRLPHLTSLHLSAIYSYPSPTPPLFLPSLQHLSLGVIPDPPSDPHRAEYSLTWDPLLPQLTLPSLTHLTCPLLLPSHSSSLFITTHGPHLTSLSTSTAYTLDFLLDALAACPSLQDLILIPSPDLSALPAYHPTLRRLCILSAIDVSVRVPPKIYQHAVLAPLDALLCAAEGMMAPKLREVRVRNSGAYDALNAGAPEEQEHRLWLSRWWNRWDARRVRFVDKDGATYKLPEDPGET